ncbi:MAG: hypothetical protein EA403_16615 [Spirochaetaceae bacterium]|nr:MAG: hypothetical protein EA403_16615 [Spirochaetaceae bacterium]
MNQRPNEDGRITYHYRRDERLASRRRGCADCDESGRPRRTNRSLRIILLDVVLIVIIYAVITTFFLPHGWRGSVGGLNVALRVEASSDAVRYVLTATPRWGLFAGDLASSDIVGVQFLEDQRPVGTETVDIPPARGEERVFTMTRPADVSAQRIQARVRLDDTATTLTVVRRQ